MKCMNRNKTAFYYAKFVRREQETDEYGNALGEGYNVYGNPIKAKANISTATGEAETLQFGDSFHYDKVIITNKGFDIDEYSVLWIDTLHVINDDGSTDTPYDYIVKKVARSLNSVSVAISKVNVSGEAHDNS